MTEKQPSKQPSEWLRRLPWIGERVADRIERAPIVPVIQLSGVIGQTGSAKRGLSLSALSTPLDHAFRMGRVKAVALAINSPGGSPVQSALIAKRIRALSDEKEIPVYAFCEDVAASGGYWLACAADEIYADGASIVGSIGVVSASFGFPALLDRIGVERRVHTAGDKKAMLDPFRPEDPKDVKHLKEIQKDLHEQFSAYVRERRAQRLSANEKILFSGEFWTGRKALEMGVVDGIGDLRSVMREKLGENVRFRVMAQPRGWLQRKLGVERASSLAHEVMTIFEERAIWARYGL
jgi:signal peptide peptidase SppA